MMATLILVVDDDPHSLEIVRTYLQARGYSVVTARDGREALGMLDSVQPSLVLLDVMMPGIDGWEVARRMKGRPGFGDTRIMMLTARPDRADRSDVADDFLQKPILLDELARRVERILRAGEPNE
jgi:CheY-like chemotaxis protein